MILVVLNENLGESLSCRWIRNINFAQFGNVMERLRYILILLLLAGQTVLAQKVGTIAGKVSDAETRETLVGVTVYDGPTGLGTSTGMKGEYTLKLPVGTHEVKFSYVGYKPVMVKFVVEANKTVKRDVRLEPDVAMLKEVEVSGRRADRNVSELAMSVQTLDMKVISKVPALLGEVDVIKTIQLLPGVQAASEGSSGFSVRGGGTDQNLILLDEAPIYNASHFLGFFSVFNNDVVKEATLLKGDIPAVYGGRLSSVLDVKVKDEIPPALTYSGGIGLITSRLSVEAPFNNNQTSVLLAGRTTYAGLVMPFLGENMRGSNLYFYDLNGKIIHRINSKNQISLSAYSGNDEFLLSKKVGVGYGNKSVSARWNHIFGDKLVSDLNFLVSAYNMHLDILFDPYDFTLGGSLRDMSLKYNMKYIWNENHTTKFGVSATRHDFGQGSLEDRGGALSQYLGVDANTEVMRKAMEYAAYVSHDHNLGSRFSLRYGLRLSAMQNFGHEEFFVFDSNYNVSDTIVYGKGEFFHTEIHPEPRLAAMYRIDEQSSVKASYSRTVQYVQVASNATGGLPFEVWFPSSPNVKPQKCGQYSVGYFRNFKNDAIETSFEVYYKNMTDVADFKDNAQTYANLLIDGELRCGKGRSYGAEFLVRKNTGNLTGWISYTYARSFRTISDINFGREYRSPFDRPHNFVIVMSYEINDRLDVSANWIYNTGQPVTYPYGKYTIDNATYAIYNGTRNESRYPSYHRLDLSVNYKTKKRSWKKFDGVINVSVYNVYANKNTWAVTFETDEAGNLITNKMYLFSAVPSISYNFKF